MHKWLRDNNKKLLAFFGVFLMVAFLLPTTFSGGGMGNPQIGVMADGTKVYAREVEIAAQEWSFLASSVLLPSGPQGAAGGGEAWDSILAQLNVGAAAPAMRENKLVYFLLQKEAERLGARPTPQQLDDVLQAVRIVLPDGRQVAYDNIRETREGRFARQAVGNALAVQAAFRRAASAVKVTRPQRDAEMAIMAQTLSLKLVPYASKDHLATVSDPSPEALQQHFEQHADTLPDQPTKDNPFGFGYRWPDRVKVQFIAVTRDELRRAVLENPQIGQTPEDRSYYWEKEAYKYFLNNRDKFANVPATQPATQPGEQPISLAGGGASSSAPTTAPSFDAVKPSAIEMLIAPEIESLSRKVQGRITAALNTDYVAWERARAAGQSAPATALGPAYDSFDYLQSLANDVQRVFGVLPTVVNLADQPRDQQTLEADLGPVAAGAFAMVGGSALNFAEYALGAAEAFAPADQKDRPGILSLYEPSQVLSAAGGGIVQFRLTAAEPSHKPASLEEVRDRVLADVKAKLAFDAARAAAQALLEAANANTDGGKVALDQAAIVAGKPVLSVNDIRLNVPIVIPGLPGGSLTPFGQRELAMQAFDLLALPADDPAKPPRAVIELHREGLALVAELVHVEGALPQELLPLAEAQMAQQLTAQMMQPVAMGWFSYPNVAKRVGFNDPTLK